MVSRTIETTIKHKRFRLKGVGKLGPLKGHEKVSVSRRSKIRAKGVAARMMEKRVVGGSIFNNVRGEL